MFDKLVELEGLLQPPESLVSEFSQDFISQLSVCQEGRCNTMCESNHWQSICIIH